MKKVVLQCVLSILVLTLVFTGCSHHQSVSPVGDVNILYYNESNGKWVEVEPALPERFNKTEVDEEYIYIPIVGDMYSTRGAAREMLREKASAEVLSQIASKVVSMFDRVAAEEGSTEDVKDIISASIKKIKRQSAGYVSYTVDEYYDLAGKKKTGDEWKTFYISHAICKIEKKDAEKIKNMIIDGARKEAEKQMEKEKLDKVKKTLERLQKKTIDEFF